MMSELIDMRKALKAQMKVLARMIAEAPPVAPPVAGDAPVAVAVVPKPTKGSAHTAFTKQLMSIHLPKGAPRSAEFQEFLEARVASAAAGELLYVKGMEKVSRGKRAIGDKMTPEEAKVGAHIAFVGFYRSKHPEEWQAYEAQWKAQHAGVVETDIVPEPVAMAAPVPVAVAMAMAAPVPMPMHVSSSIAELIANYGSEGESAASSSAPKRRGRKALKDMTPEELAAHNVKVAVMRAKKAAAAAGGGGGSSV